MKFILTLFFLSFTIMASAQDWQNLAHYKEENEKLSALPTPKDRVVFMGNSITDLWYTQSPQFFTDHHFINRGIGGQTSPQMLLRFCADVVALHPRAVVIECGTNDIAGNTGPSTLGMIEDNIMGMVDIARANKIKVFLGSVLPANKFGWRPELQPADSIIALNVWIKNYAQMNRIVYIDYYTSLVDDQKGLKTEYSPDGVHPNKYGYDVMEGIALPIIQKQL